MLTERQKEVLESEGAEGQARAFDHWQAMLAALPVMPIEFRAEFSHSPPDIFCGSTSQMITRIVMGAEEYEDIGVCMQLAAGRWTFMGFLILQFGDNGRIVGTLSDAAFLAKNIRGARRRADSPSMVPPPIDTDFQVN